MRYEIDEVDALLDWFRHGKVLSNLNNFDPYYMSSKNSLESVFGKALQNLRTLKHKYARELKAELNKQLSNKTDRTFGEEMLLSFTKSDPINIYQILGSNLETFSALPIEQQTRLARFAREVTDMNLADFNVKRVINIPTSAESTAVKKICSQLLNKSFDSKIEKVIKAKQ